MTKHTLHAGVEQVDITPPLGVEMCGYGPYEKRKCTQVLDPLYARALWLQSGDSDLLIIAADVCTIDRSTRDRITSALAQTPGIDPARVLIAASHTHSGPAMQPLIAWGKVEDSYLGTFVERVVRAARQAHADLQPATLGCARARVESVGINREHPTFGVLDPAAQLMRVNRTDGSALAIVYNYAAHPVTRYPFTSRLSADWPGLVNASLRERFDGAMPIFLQGCAGDINGHDVIFQRRDVERMQAISDSHTGEVARRVLQQITPALERIACEAASGLDARLRDIDLPLGTVDADEMRRLIDANAKAAEQLTLADLRPLHQRMLNETEEEVQWRQARYTVDYATRQLDVLNRTPATMPAPVQVMRIGEAAIVVWPAEVFVELGIELRQRSQTPMTFVNAYANRCVGYIPTSWAYESQGKATQFGVYPTTVTPRIWGELPFRADVADVLVNETLAMLNHSE